jgi:hypothetical protein
VHIVGVENKKVDAVAAAGQKQAGRGEEINR